MDNSQKLIASAFVALLTYLHLSGVDVRSITEGTYAEYQTRPESAYYPTIAPPFWLRFWSKIFRWRIVWLRDFVGDEYFTKEIGHTRRAYVYWFTRTGSVALNEDGHCGYSYIKHWKYYPVSVADPVAEAKRLLAGCH
jgi:hypothetical protein